MVILILLAAVACSADRSRHMLDLSVSTSEFSEPDVIKGGEPLAPWNTYGEHKAIDDSSYQEFFIKSDSPHNVTLLSESNDLVGMIPFMFLTIPEPNDREKNPRRSGSLSLLRVGVVLLVLQLYESGFFQHQRRDLGRLQPLQVHVH
mmetsp:Transcript_20008/g.37203  ORF Transcript_20008/g.37203 Transcript_20008/m.37203 type:complete len:147 (-) Transcript_20008:3209-3649(-)